MALISACVLTGCSMSGTTTPTAIPVANSYGQVQNAAAEPTKSLQSAYSTDYFSFPFDPSTMEVTDLSDGSVTGNYILVEPKAEGQLTHVELFGGEKITVPSGYTAEIWGEYAKELVSSYYAEPARAKLTVTAADMQQEGAISMSATIHAEAVDDIPAMTAEVRGINGEQNSVIMVFTQYEADQTDITPYQDLMNHIKVY